MAALLILNFIFPFVMLLVGSILKKNPVSDRASHNGYNTPTSRKSQAHWDYAQSIAPGIFIAHGKVLLIVETVWTILSLVLVMAMASLVVVNISFGVGMVIGAVGLAIAFIKTENCIKDKFPDEI